MCWIYQQIGVSQVDSKTFVFFRFDPLQESSSSSYDELQFSRWGCTKWLKHLVIKLSPISRTSKHKHICCNWYCVQINFFIIKFETKSNNPKPRIWFLFHGNHQTHNLKRNWTTPTPKSKSSQTSTLRRT